MTILDDRAVVWLTMSGIKATSRSDRVFPVSKRSLQRDCRKVLGYPPHAFPPRLGLVESLRAGVSQVSVQAVADGEMARCVSGT